MSDTTTLDNDVTRSLESPDPARAGVQALLDRLNQALARRDARAAAELFATESYWRDLVLLTWNLKTMEGPAAVQDMLDAQFDAIESVVFGIDPNGVKKACIEPPMPRLNPALRANISARVPSSLVLAMTALAAFLTSSV